MNHGDTESQSFLFSVSQCLRGEDALRETRRVLKPGGVLLLTFHIGEEVKHVEEWREKQVNLDFAFCLPEEVEAWLKEAGF